MDKLLPYLVHLGNCHVNKNIAPDDERCICDLRQIWVELSNNYKHMMAFLPPAYKEGGK